MGVAVLYLLEANYSSVTTFTLSAPQDLKDQLVFKVQENTTNQKTLIWDQEDPSIGFIKARKKRKAKVKESPRKSSRTRKAKVNSEVKPETVGLDSKASMKPIKEDSETEANHGNDDSDVEIVTVTVNEKPSRNGSVEIHDLLDWIEECFGKLQIVSSPAEGGEKYIFRQRQVPAWKK